MKSLRGTSLGGLFASTIVLAPAYAGFSTYDPRIISDMPTQAEIFIQRIDESSRRVHQYSSTPGMRRGVNNLENYYNLQVDNFMRVMRKNLNTMGAADDVVDEALSSTVIGSCLDNSNRRSFSDFRDALEGLDGLKTYVTKNIERGQMANFGMISLRNDRGLASDINQSYNRVSKYLDLKKRNSGLLRDLRECCDAAGAKRSTVSVCDENYVKDKLSELGNLEALPADFVDPLQPGAFAQNLTSDDIMTMISLGQMNDFINATDFNVQAGSLMNADLKCQDAREEALRSLGHKAQFKGLAQTALHTLHCNTWSFAQNWSKGARTVALGVTKSPFPLFNMVSQCPPEIQEAATLALTYSADQFRSDFQTLGSLPGHIAYSSPVAMPVATGFVDKGMMTLELRDEPGYIQSSMLISANPEKTVVQNTSLAVNVSTNIGSGSSGSSKRRTTTSNVMRGMASDSRGASVVRGTGESTGNRERLSVRTLANKTSEGDLESARTLASSVKGRASKVRSLVTKMKGDRTLASRSAARATASRELVGKETSVRVARGTSKVLEGAYRNLFRSLDSGGGRVVERANGGSTGTKTDKSGTKVTNNTASADTQARVTYQEEQQRKNQQAIMTTIGTVGTSLNTVAERLNDIISKKREAIDKYRIQFEPAKLYAQLTELGAEDRANKLISLSKEWSRTVKKITTLNTQELGLRVALNTGKSSLQNLIAGAQAFQGLNVQVGNVRGPASALPGQPTGSFVNGSIPALQLPVINQSQSPFFNGGQPPVNLLPPQFTPSPSLTMNDINDSAIVRLFDFITFPKAHATPLTLEQKREKLRDEWGAFLEQYDSYQARLAAEDLALKKQMWDRFVVNERENRADGYLSSEVRVIVGTFNRAVQEELPDLLAVKNAQGIPAGANKQIYNYIEDIRRGSGELNEALLEEVKLNLQTRATDPDLDEESWTGLLPAMALQ